MKLIVFLLLVILLLLGIMALVGAMILLYDEVLDVMEKHHMKHDRRCRRP